MTVMAMAMTPSLKPVTLPAVMVFSGSRTLEAPRWRNPLQAMRRSTRKFFLERHFRSLESGDVAGAVQKRGNDRFHVIVDLRLGWRCIDLGTDGQVQIVPKHRNESTGSEDAVRDACFATAVCFLEETANPLDHPVRAIRPIRIGGAFEEAVACGGCPVDADHRRAQPGANDALADVRQH